jgi:hypothetical protein
MPAPAISNRTPLQPWRLGLVAGADNPLRLTIACDLLCPDLPEVI